MSVSPVGGVDYPTTYQQLLKWFPDNQACLEYLAKLRWPRASSARPAGVWSSGALEPDCGCAATASGGHR